MSVVYAVMEVRAYLASNPSVPLSECCRILRATPGAASSYDYDTAFALRHLHGVMHPSVGPRQAAIREVLRTLIIELRPTWGLLLPQGRKMAYNNLPVDVRQCLDMAGAFQVPPDPESITWWDELSTIFRSDSVLGRVEVGRRGEMLSMDRERAQLVAAGHVGLEPRWVALDDETVGYDVTSFRGAAGNAQMIHIEVKASERLPFSFFLTENEWRMAQHFGSRYVFHLWYLPARRVQEVDVAQLEPHVPVNRGNGAWRKTLIQWPF